MADPRLLAQIRIDAICDHFEQHWSPALRPDFGFYLQHVAPELRDELLEHLLVIDVQLRLNAGQAVTGAEYEQLGESAAAIVQEVVAKASRLFEIRVSSNLERGKSLVLQGKTTFTIGRDSGCDLRLSSPHVSHRHLRLEVVDGQAILTDHSKNGTRVNGNFVRRHVLCPGDVVAVADYQLVFEVASASVPGEHGQTSS